LVTYLFKTCTSYSSSRNFYCSTLSVCSLCCVKSYRSFWKRC